MKYFKKAIVLLLCAALWGAAFTVPALAAALSEYDDNDGRIYYGTGWTMFDTVSGSYDGTVHSAPSGGATMSARFSNCTYIALYGGRSSNLGMLDIYIDGELMCTADCYSAEMQTCVLLYQRSDMKMGEHTITVTVSEKVNPASSSTWTELDKFVSDGVLEETTADEAKDPETGNQIVDDPVLAYNGTWSKYAMLDSARGYYNNTASSTTEAGAFFEYTFGYCTGIRWYSTSGGSYGRAEVFIDGKSAGQVDCSQKNQISGAVFDSGELKGGMHTLKVVNLDEGKFLETDRIIGVGESDKFVISALNTSYFKPAGFTKRLDSDAAKTGSVLYADGSAAVTLNFFGSYISLYGLETDGEAEFVLDGGQCGKTNLSNLENGRICSFTGLEPLKVHTLIIKIDGEAMLEYAEVETSMSVYQEMSKAAYDELEIISSGKKEALDSSLWKPVERAAAMPESGVTLHGGVLGTAFEKNIKYIKYCYSKKNNSYVDQTSVWTTDLAASTEGRVLNGAGESLRWTEDAELRAIVDDMVGDIAARAKENGWCLPYDESNFEYLNGQLIDEDKNYDRVMFSEGLLAAGRSGSAEAYTLLRNFYDWFNNCQYLDVMLKGGMAVQGALAGPYLYFTPAGRVQDIYTNMEYFDQDWWMYYLSQGVPEAFYRYPLNRSHGNLLSGVIAFVYEYRATGEEKYLDAVLGAWDIINNYYINIGGGLCICEGPEYLPGNHSLNTAAGIYENCCNVWWAELNSLLMELFPQQERFASAMERSIYNMLAGSQDADGKIRYFQLLNGAKYPAMAVNTCCENQATGQLGALPQYVYSVSEDGLYVNLFAASDINFEHDGSQVTVSASTDFPYSGEVTLTVGQDVGMAMHVRVPSWNAGAMDIYVNGEKTVSGEPGSYAEISRDFYAGDKITFTLSMELTAHRYTGVTQIDGAERWGFTYGPVMLAALGGLDPECVQAEAQPVARIDKTITEFMNQISMEEGTLTFAIDGEKHWLMPYFAVQEQAFSVFPAFNIGDETTPEVTVTPDATVQPGIDKNAPLGTAVYVSIGAAAVAGASIGAAVVVKKKKQYKQNK